jgi:hypothetical protein
MQFRILIFPVLSLLFLVLPQVQAQTKAEKKSLAEEYIKRENFSKALDYLEDLVGDEAFDSDIFPSYILCLEKVKPSRCEAAIRKFIKRYPRESRYSMYYFSWLTGTRKDKEAAGSFARSKLLPFFLKTSDQSQAGYRFFTENNEELLAGELLDQAIQRFGISPFWKERIRGLLARRQFADAARLVGDLLAEKTVEEVEIQAHLQESLSTSGWNSALSAEILKRIQSSPGQTIYPSFLAWQYLQVRDYEGAFIQNKALDLLENNGGTRTFQLGELCLSNEERSTALQCFEFIIGRFPGSQYRFLSQQKLIQLREEQIRNTYPVSKPDVRALIRDYEGLSQSQYLNVFDLTLKMAELYGKYLNEPDSAISLLEKSLKQRRWIGATLGKAKILLADLYILRGEPWEASLLYGQVEKDEAESLIGFEAKLKNAKVFYFKGEFELCVEQLDVLKQSTSRDISNDAIELGLLIQDILAEDTTGFFLGKFAEIDMLTFQGNYPAAVDKIDGLLGTTTNAVVTERLRYRQFRNMEAMRRFEEALSLLDTLYKTRTSDLYLDDALFYSGLIWSEKLKNKEKSMDYFLRLIKEIPGSVFVAEARKRLRILRGDAVN